MLDSLTYAGSTDNLPDEMRQIDHPRMRFWYGDVTNAEVVNTLVAEANYVIHFAAETHVTRSIFDNRLFFETDVMGAHTVANAVLKSNGRVARFIHISSSEVYGTALKPLMDEEHPLYPMSPYASAKCGADRLVYSYWATYGIPATIIRPFTTFGPRQHLEKVIPRFITSMVLNEKLTVHGTGAAARDFVYVGDICRGIDIIMHADAHKVDGEVFNLASVDRTGRPKAYGRPRERYRVSRRPAGTSRTTLRRRKQGQTVIWLGTNDDVGAGTQGDNRLVYKQSAVVGKACLDATDSHCHSRGAQGISLMFFSTRVSCKYSATLMFAEVVSL